MLQPLWFPCFISESVKKDIAKNSGNIDELSNDILSNEREIESNAQTIKDNEG